MSFNVAGAASNDSKQHVSFVRFKLPGTEDCYYFHWRIRGGDCWATYLKARTLFGMGMTNMECISIRRAAVSEQKELEDLQLRASLTNAGDRDALLAYPDAIELPLAQIA